MKLERKKEREFSRTPDNIIVQIASYAQSHEEKKIKVIKTHP